MDKLVQLFVMQRHFQEELGYDFNNMTNKELAEYIHEYAFHCEHELHEMLQELPYFKSWKRYDTCTDTELRNMFIKAEQEYVDVLHFFLNIGIALGFTGEELFRRFCDKHDLNHKRQEITDYYKKCVEVPNEASSTGLPNA